MIVYSVTDQRSFEQVKKWMNFVNDNAPKNVKIMLIGNKKDLVGKREVPEEAGLECSQQFQIPFMETSAYDGQNIEKAFVQLGEIILKNLELNQDVPRPIGFDHKEKKKCCKG